MNIAFKQDGKIEGFNFEVLIQHSCCL